MVSLNISFLEKFAELVKVDGEISSPVHDQGNSNSVSGFCAEFVCQGWFVCDQCELVKEEKFKFNPIIPVREFSHLISGKKVRFQAFPRLISIPKPVLANLTLTKFAFRDYF